MFKFLRQLIGKKAVGYDAQDAIISLESARTHMPLHCRKDEDVTEPIEEVLEYLVRMVKKGF